ncbi:MAG: 23S rRNA (adenine(2030)-N(6))-methyltransferase RlmJ [Methylophilaceae bacterium]
MLSYRHAFHAGNHADVLKHFVLDQVLTYTTQKDKPFWMIDTHAGAGLYSLEEGFATQNTEHASGIARLANSVNLPESLAAYLAKIKKLNKSNQLSVYPGSPMIAKIHLRHNDKMRLFELHPSDSKLLFEHFKTLGKQVRIEALDGFAGLKSLLPPPSKRAVVLIDPPYEEKKDYQRVVNTIQDSMARFATGTYIIWYPLLQRPEPLQMLEKLTRLQIENWLNVTLTVRQPSVAGFGMHGSGLYVINPSWTLPIVLREAMPVLAKLLAQDTSATYALESKIK